MNRLLGLIAALASLCAIAPLASAQQTVGTTLPEGFIVGRGPEGAASAAPQPAPAAQPMREASASTSVERAQDTPGLPQKYTVVAPIFLGGSTGTISYLRFFNGQNTTTYVNVLVVGNHTGHVYGTMFVTEPVTSSAQYSIQDILQAAGVTGFIGNDDGYSLYLEDTSNAGNNGFQHVIFNGYNKFFENASMCTYHNNEGVQGVNQILINVHTSVLSAYPSYIYLHNYYTQPVNYTVTIADARTGQVIGTVDLQQLQPNTTYSVPFTFFETVLNWTPRANQEHANMVFHGNPGYYAIAGQMIYNQQFGSYVNMTHFCAINHYDPSALQ